MLKIRRPLGRLIFNMGIAIPGKTVFLIETAPRADDALPLTLLFQVFLLDDDGQDTFTYIEGLCIYSQEEKDALFLNKTTPQTAMYTFVSELACEEVGNLLISWDMILYIINQSWVNSRPPVSVIMSSFTWLFWHQCRCGKAVSIRLSRPTNANWSLPLLIEANGIKLYLSDTIIQICRDLDSSFCSGFFYNRSSKTCEITSAVFGGDDVPKPVSPCLLQSLEYHRRNIYIGKCIVLMITIMKLYEFSPHKMLSNQCFVWF